MDLIQMTRELGKEIQRTHEYQRVTAAKEANDHNMELQTQISEFNMLRVKISTEMQKPNHDEKNIEKYNDELKAIYDTIMSNENMVEFNLSKQGIDKLMMDIHQILSMCVNGQDPDTCEINPNYGDDCGEDCSGDCGGDCGGCSGCQ